MYIYNHIVVQLTGAMINRDSCKCVVFTSMHVKGRKPRFQGNQTEGNNRIPTDKIKF